MSKAEMKSVCQIRLIYGLPCEKCRFSDKCSANKKGDKKNEQKKQRKHRKDIEE